MDKIEPLSRSSNLINADDCFIIIIDVQEAFMQGLTKEEQSVFLRKYKHIIKLSHTLKIPLIITAEDIQKNGSIPDTLLKSLPKEVPVLDKFVYSCWGQKNIQEAIKKTKRPVVILCGFETDVCIAQTSIDLFDNGYKVIVLIDMTFSNNNLNNEIGRKRVEHHGVILASLRSWQEEITGGIRTAIHQTLERHGLTDI